MADILISQPAALATKRTRNTALAASASNDVFSGAATIRALTISNIAGAAAAYYKSADAAAFTVGTTQPALQARVAAGKQLFLHLTTGWVLSTGLSHCAVANPATSDTTAPNAAQDVEAFSG